VGVGAGGESSGGCRGRGVVEAGGEAVEAGLEAAEAGEAAPPPALVPDR
jgi:hypothetical protein